MPISVLDLFKNKSVDQLLALFEGGFLSEDFECQRIILNIILERIIFCDSDLSEEQLMVLDHLQKSVFDYQSNLQPGNPISNETPMRAGSSSMPDHSTIEADMVNQPDDRSNQGIHNPINASCSGINHESLSAPPYSPLTLSDTTSRNANHLQGNNNVNNVPQGGAGTATPRLKITTDIERHYDRFNLKGRRLTFRLPAILDDENPLEWLRGSLHELLERGLSGVPDTDWVGLLLCNENYPDRPVHLSFRRRNQLSEDVIMATMENVMQSNAEFFSSDLLCLHVDIVAEEVGRGRDTKVRRLTYEKFRQQNKGIVAINNNDTYCLAYALALAIEFRVDRDGIDFELMKMGGYALKNKALKLCRDAQVNLDQGATYTHLQTFQDYLTKYTITVYNHRAGRTVFFEGPVEDNRQRLNLYFENNHFDVIVNILTTFACDYYCEKCKLGYNDRQYHSNCPFICSACHTAPACNSMAVITCGSCNRDFKGEVCLQRHKSYICRKLHRCTKCLYTYWERKKQPHKCGYKFCKNCCDTLPMEHKCYMRPVQTTLQKWLELNKKFLFVFYDFEATQDTQIGNSGKFLHVPNLCVIQQVCAECINSPESLEIPCDNCGKRQFVFEEDPVKNFLDHVSSMGDKFNITCIAHNMKGYDGCFVLKALMAEHSRWTPNIIRTGTKIMSIVCGNIRFIDSLNFIPMALSKFPAAFNFEATKGYFPHFFNTKANRNYVGPVPDAIFYGVDDMLPKDRERFLEWHTTQASKNFNMNEEIKKYCVMDVNILRMACVKFRELFVKNSRVDPFQECITIASTCSLIFRKNYLKKNVIGIIPQGRYRLVENQSRIALQWLYYLERTENIFIQHAGNGREKRIGGNIWVDGFCEARNTAYQFHGCYFHGCLDCYPLDLVENFTEEKGKEMFLRRERTFAQDAKIRSLGYNLVTVWECQFKRRKRDSLELKNFITNNKELFAKEPLDPRDAFFGGRTNVVKMHHKCKQDERIRYFDFTSLYPYCNKTGKIPVGHPKLYVGHAECKTLRFEEIEGLVKCTVLPPRNLFHPVLPYRCNGKLTFPLCRTCADSCNQARCTHDETDRTITGTWVSDELKHAVTRGYKVLKFLEIWQYEVETYDPKTKSGGVFTHYVNKFLRIKQECSGWPSWVQTEDDKDQYISRYLEREGVQLDKSKIEDNPPLRYISKLLLNSFWGKFGQRENKSQTSIVSNVCELYRLLNDPDILVDNILPINDNTVLATWHKEAESCEPLRTVNVAIAAYTTATARLHLLRVLERLGTRVLYFDTDSVIFIEKEGEQLLTTGDYLGEFTDELLKYGVGSYITEFVSAGPKNYSYVVFSTRNGQLKYECKIKGITLNYKNSLILNFEAMKNIVCNNGPSLKVHNSHKIVRSSTSSEVISKPESKKYTMNVSKRRRLNNNIVGNCYDTVPYGFIAETSSSSQ